ncbi:MAG: cytochrome c family protein [Sedimentisphaerales bacterium]|nr:cytochrome c family protein [Sedimentisphaerales bacterium]
MNIFTKTRIRIAGAVLLAGLAIGISCGPKGPSETPSHEKERRRGDTLTVFITGNTLGELKPCGCSGGQLGGLDRRSVVFNRVPADKRLILDTGALVRNDLQQDLIKFNVTIQALSLLKYHVVNLTEKDVEISRNLGLLDDPILNFISPYTTDEGLAKRFQSRYSLKGESVTVNVVTYDAEVSSIERVRELFGPDQPDEKKINILLLNRFDDAIYASIAKMGMVDCIICPAVSDEPMSIGDSGRNPLAVSVGRLGRYIGKLQIGAIPGKGDFEFTFQSIAVGEDLEQDAALIDLYKDYQYLVKEANLLEEHSRFILPNGLKYIGSKSCMACHDYEYKTWSSNAHARAFATLERVGSNYDPECVVCHVVGMNYQSGFITQEKTPQKKDVGCENCHGPGSEHVKSVGMTPLTEPKSVCTDCHTPEHSGEYAGNEEAFRKKIIHWREPNAAQSVK